QDRAKRRRSILPIQQQTRNLGCRLVRSFVPSLSSTHFRSPPIIIPHDPSNCKSNTEVYLERPPACAVSVGRAGSTAVRFPLHSGVIPGSASRSSLVSVLVYQAIMSSALLTFSLCLHHY